MLNVHTIKNTSKLILLFTNDEIMTSLLSYVANQNVTSILPSTIISFFLYNNTKSLEMRLNDNEEKIKIPLCGEQLCEFENFKKNVEEKVKEIGNITRQYHEIDEN